MINFNSVQIDLANAIQNKLLHSGDAPEMKGTTFPWQPASIVRYQKEHPGIEAVPITDTAPKLLVSRLVYVELSSISTRGDASVQMYRGSAIASLKVVEVHDGRAQVAYEESDIHATFPPKSPPEGVINSSDIVMYRGTLDALAQQIVDRLTTHVVE